MTSPNYIVGHDEHGPAYPEPDIRHERMLSERTRGPTNIEPEYRCPICRGDKDRFAECEYPGCPDGRDRHHPYALLIETYDGPKPIKSTTARWLVGVAVAMALVLGMLWPRLAPAMDHGFNPNEPTAHWFESLMRPDFNGPCCGKGDAYEVTRFWRDEHGTMFAEIGDGSAVKWPDGKTREPIPDGTIIRVPDTKINSLDDDLDNPTDKSWLFMTVYHGEVSSVICLVRHPQGG